MERGNMTVGAVDPVPIAGGVCTEPARVLRPVGTIGGLINGNQCLAFCRGDLADRVTEGCAVISSPGCIFCGPDRDADDQDTQEKGER